MLIAPLIGLIDPDPFNLLPAARLKPAQAAALLLMAMHAAKGLLLQA